MNADGSQKTTIERKLQDPWVRGRLARKSFRMRAGCPRTQENPLGARASRPHLLENAGRMPAYPDKTGGFSITSIEAIEKPLGARASRPHLLENADRMPAFPDKTGGFSITSIETIENQKPSTGSLYIVATPIGNLEDITLRALRVLKEADVIACEDTRHTAKLLARYGINTPRKSCHDFNEESRISEFIGLLRRGKNIALVGDAGTPLISDPGYKIVSACRMEGIAVIPIPGASAAVAALSASGLPSDSFFFAGFLPSRASPRRRRLEELAAIPAVLIFYEAPHRLVASLKDMASILGARRCALAREITKIHEEFLCGTLFEILDAIMARPEIRGEITLVIENGSGKVAPAPVFPESIREHLEEEMEKNGSSRNDALKTVARARGISRREAYRLIFT